MKVLLVDQSVAMRRIQRGILSQLGYTRIEEVRSGAEALVKMETFGPQFVLMAWDLPDMEATNLVQRIRAARCGALIVAAVTDRQAALAKQAMGSGVDTYVVKPFTPVTLRERIRQGLSRLAAAA